MRIKFSLAVIVLLAIVLGFFIITQAARVDFEARVFEPSAGNVLPYRIHVPNISDKNRKYPLVVFFHGSGERGEDNYAQLLLGVNDILKFTRKHNDPAIIIAPQVPTNQQWVDKPWFTDVHIMPEQPSQSMALTMELITRLISSYPVDTKRIYVTGLSMGGFGTWDILQRNPQIFAAAVPVCGGGDINYAETIKDIPVWAFHGDSDEVVKPKLTRNLIFALQAIGGKPKYTEYKGVGHNSWTQTYADENVLSWLFGQKKL
jgi:predicted peptidase